MTTIGLVANVYNEANALPGWLETHIQFFDDVRVLHAGPRGLYSNDGTIEILERWKIPVQFCPIDDGFGVVRTKALRMSPCDWVMLLDADERFYSVHSVITYAGNGDSHEKIDWILQQYDFHGVALPNWENIEKLGDGLYTKQEGIQDQGAMLRKWIENDNYDAIATVRRHWHDLARTRPTQGWVENPDWQLRTVRNDQNIRFDSNTHMHERLLGAQSIHHADIVFGPFFDHFHFTFKRMEQEQRRHDIAIYDAIHKGEAPPLSL